MTPQPPRPTTPLPPPPLPRGYCPECRNHPLDCDCPASIRTQPVAYRAGLLADLLDRMAVINSRGDVYRQCAGLVRAYFPEAMTIEQLRAAS